jgi:hypothetical protein
MQTTGGADLKIDGGEENVFDDCVIGLDTISRDNTSKGNVWFDTAAARNWFRKCYFPAHISNDAYVHLTVQDATGIDRVTVFEDCIFSSISTNYAKDQTAISTLPAITQGRILMKECYIVGDIEDQLWDSSATGKIAVTSRAAVADAALAGVARFDDP